MAAVTSHENWELDTWSIFDKRHEVCVRVIFFQPGFRVRVTVFVSFRRRFRITLNYLHCPYFLPKKMVKFRRRAKGHFVTLIEIVGMHLITCISWHNWKPSCKFLLDKDSFLTVHFDTGGSLVLGVDVQGHVKVVYKSEAFCANNLSIVTEEDTIDCCQSATVVSGEDPPRAAAVIYSGALYQPIGQSVNGARYGCS